jgi:hypothetical protein
MTFAATRDITGADFASLVESLKARGYDVEPFYAGVRWRDAACRKDLRFACGSASGFVVPVRRIGDVYEFENDKVAFEHATPVWCEANGFKSYAQGEFTPDELLAIRHDMATTFGAVENIIENEGRGILPTDSNEAIRLFLYFDRNEAIEKWSIPSPSFPGAEDERLFKCWKCNCYNPSCDYENEGWYHVTAFDRLLGRYELKGTLPCCDECRSSMCNVKWTPRTTKLLSTHPI